MLSPLYEKWITRTKPETGIKMANLHNVIDDIKHALFPNGEVSFDVRSRRSGRWIVYVSILNGEGTAKLEFLIDEGENEDDVEVLGSVLRYGPVSRVTIARIMDSVLERM